MKKRWFSLWMAVLLVFSAAAFSDSVYKANASAGYASVQLESYARQVAGIVNRERAANGLSPLRYSDKLSQAALVRADEIQSVFSHTRPNGTRCFTVLSEAGVSYSSAGENIAYGQRDPEDVMHSWMNSSGHRANILGSYEYIGIGVAYRNGTYYWTQFFAASNGLSGEIITLENSEATASTTKATSTTKAATVTTQSGRGEGCSKKTGADFRTRLLRLLAEKWGIEKSASNI